MTVAGGGGAAGAGAGTAAGAGAAVGAAGAGVSVVVDGCCALALMNPPIERANAIPSVDDAFNRFMDFLPGTLFMPVNAPTCL